MGGRTLKEMCNIPNAGFRPYTVATPELSQSTQAWGGAGGEL